VDSRPDGDLEAGTGLAAGNAVVLKPAEQTPASIHSIELIADLLRPRASTWSRIRRRGRQTAGVTSASARSPPGETTTGRLIMQYASENLTVTLELGGKSPNVFFDDVAAHRDAFYDKDLRFRVRAEPGRGGTCPFEGVDPGWYLDDFLSESVKRVRADQQGHPLTPNHDRRQASNDR